MNNNNNNLWGAYVWKNEKNITDKRTRETTFYAINNRWVKPHEYMPSINERYVMASGQAVLQIDTFCIEFYKNYAPQIVELDGKRRSAEDNAVYYDKYYDLSIELYSINESGTLKWAEIKYKDTNYLVIYGEGIRTRFGRNVAKEIIKNVCYVDGTYRFRAKKKYYVPIYIVLGKAQRKDLIEYRKYILKEKLCKAAFKSLISLDFQKYKRLKKRIKETKLEIKYLK